MIFITSEPGSVLNSGFYIIIDIVNLLRYETISCALPDYKKELYLGWCVYRNEDIYIYIE